MSSLYRLTASAVLLFTSLIQLPCSLARAVDATPIHDRDWKQYPAIVELPASKMVYALGDVHADCDKMLQLLAAAKLIKTPAKPGQIQWTGADADLVLLGDMIDKYDQSLPVLEVLRALEPQAKKAGGRLVVCLGNHEAEFLAAGGESAKSAEFARELSIAHISSEDVASGRDKDRLGEWLRTLPVGARVGDWFFCHAGNTGGLSLHRLESELETDLAEKGYATPFLMNANSMLEARMHPRPWWTVTGDPALHEVKKQSKKEAIGPPAASQIGVPKNLLSTVSALGVKHLVIGHQPGKLIFEDGGERKAGEMCAHYDGLFFMIDTGMSRGVTDGRGALLQIRTTADHVDATAVYADGNTTLLWQN